MRLTKLTIRNYKSLKSIEIQPEQFSVIVGRNSSGKSNFADALEFLSLAYAHGLEHAVAKKGGYENIAHRKERRSRSGVMFSIELRGDLSENEAFGTSGSAHAGVNTSIVALTFRHSFEFRSTGEGIRSEFRVVSEQLEIIRDNPTERRDTNTRSYQWVNIQRSKTGTLTVEGDKASPLARAVLFDPKYWTGDAASDFVVSPSELIFVLPFFKPRIVGRFISLVRNLGVFQLSPDVTRHPGVPTPNPNLSVRGENLPAVVDWLQRNRQREWKQVMSAMREIVPEIQQITVDYLHTRTLGLFFHEEGVGRPWTAEQVSDGTIRALALLVACFDPRNTALVIEEPENSLHPWIIKDIVNRLRMLAKHKMVIITSHSPVVLNMLSPSEVWVIFKVAGETRIEPLVKFDSLLLSDWESGKYRLFDYLESGFVSEAVPSGGI